MDLNDLELVANAGVVFSLELKTAMQTSLTLLKQAEKFKAVKLWGKIAGVARDYYVAIGITDNEVKGKKPFYSTDGITWAQVTSIHPVLAATAGKIRGRFTGDLSHEYVVNEVSMFSVPDLPSEVQAIRAEVARDDGSKLVTTTITEDKRLSAAILAIDHDTSIVPRGALRTTPTGSIETSRTFEGLSDTDALKLQSYFHLRPASALPKKPLLERAKLDPSIDFLDSISEDTPSIVWNLQAERGGSVVYIRHLLWPGFVFFHVPGTRQYGSVYVGLVNKNLDLPFMV